MDRTMTWQLWAALDEDGHPYECSFFPLDGAVRSHTTAAGERMGLLLEFDGTSNFSEALDVRDAVLGYGVLWVLGGLPRGPHHPEVGPNWRIRLYALLARVVPSLGVPFVENVLTVMDALWDSLDDHEREEVVAGALHRPIRRGE